jgi:uncharacterized protein (TIGR04255 family)
MRLPKKLGKEPLVDALFEMRFSSGVPVSSVLPGMIFQVLPGEKTLERLPLANAPEQMRTADQNLRYGPLLRIKWADHYMITIGDRSVGVFCRIPPYPGWTEFRVAILAVIDVLARSQFISAVERCSIKMTNVFSAEIGTSREIIKSELRLAEIDIIDHVFHIKVEIKDEKFIHIIQVASEATATMQGNKTVSGMYIDTDSISDQKNKPMEQFVSDLPQHIDELHEANKQMFFASLRDEALEKLEPLY